MIAWQAVYDVPLVQKVARMVEKRFDKDGVPPHHQPAAYNREYNGESTIFVVDCKEFNSMDPAEIHRIHRYRHILVTGVDAGKPLRFDAEGLQTLADIDRQPVWIQRKPTLSCPS